MLWRRRKLQLEGQSLERSSSRFLRLLHRMRSGDPDCALEPRGELDASAAPSPQLTSPQQLSPQQRLSPSPSPSPSASQSPQLSPSAQLPARRGVSFGSELGSSSSSRSPPLPRASPPVAASTSSESVDARERWHLLSVIDELWANCTLKRLDLRTLGPGILSELCLNEMCRALAHSAPLALAELNTLEKKFMGLIDWRVHVSGQQFELYKDFGFSLKSYIKMNLLTESAPMTTHVPKRKSSSSPRARNADAKRRRKSSSPSALSTLHPFYLMIPQQFIFLEVRF